MMKIFQKCFKRIRIASKRNLKDETVFNMEAKTELKINLQNTENPTEKILIENQLNFWKVTCL